MSRTVRSHRGAGKSGSRTNRNPNCTSGKQISDARGAIRGAVAAIKALLPADKSAWELHILSGAGFSTCQKVLSGHRELNLETTVSLLRSEHGYAVLKALLGDEPPAWFEEIEDLRDIDKQKGEVLRLKRDLERREQRRLEERSGR